MLNSAMGYIAAVGGLVVVIAMAVIGWVSYRLGQKKERLNVSERTNVDRERDAHIAAQPDIDSPASAMRKLRR